MCTGMAGSKGRWQYFSGLSCTAPSSLGGAFLLVSQLQRRDTLDCSEFALSPGIHLRGLLSLPPLSGEECPQFLRSAVTGWKRKVICAT